jgi:8-hydroxy-5-deazaflavin:NADPH oxidoreductase
VKLAVLGTGVVGTTLAARLVELGHDVVIGTRDPAVTLDRVRQNGTFMEWQAAHPTVELLALPDAGAHGDVIVNATSGVASLEALTATGANQLAGKVLLDVANPLDFSGGMPPVLSVANTDSLAEQIQRAFPDTQVVKGLNTMSAAVMVEPARVPGDHDTFIAGDNADAKAAVVGLLRSFGWAEEHIIDLGGIRAARGVEMVLPLWLTLWGALGTGDFNIGVTRA